MDILYAVTVFSLIFCFLHTCTAHAQSTHRIQHSFFFISRGFSNEFFNRRNFNPVNPNVFSVHTFDRRRRTKKEEKMRILSHRNGQAIALKSCPFCSLFATTVISSKTVARINTRLWNHDTRCMTWKRIFLMSRNSVRVLKVRALA